MSGDGQGAGAIAALLGQLFGPPLLLAYVFQFRLFARRGLLRAGEAVRVFAAALLCPLAAVTIMILAQRMVPPAAGAWLRVRIVEIAGHGWPVAPLAFLAVALATAFSTWWALHAARVRPLRRPG